MTKTNRGLSDDGQRRRQEILELAIAEGRRLRKIRIRTRVVGSCTIMLLAIVIGTYFDPFDPRSPDPRLTDRNQAAPLDSEAPRAVDGRGVGRLDGVDLADYLIDRDTGSWESHLLLEHQGAPHDINFADYLVRSDIGDWTDYLISAQDEIPDDLLLDDQQLVITLSDLDRADTLIRTGGRVWLMKDGRPIREHALLVD